MKKTVLLGMMAVAAAAFAERRVTLFNDGWTADGAPVTLPHTWNAVDGADGCKESEGFVPNPAVKEVGGTDFFKDEERFRHHNPARSDVGYARRECVYQHRLPDPRPGRRYFFKCDAASITANVYVNSRVVGRHAGAYLAFCYELTDELKPTNNVLTVVVDNRWTPDVPTLSADFTVFGGMYRDAWLIETDSDCIDPTYYGGPGVAVKTDPDTGAVEVDVKVLGDGGAISYSVGDFRTFSPKFTLPGYRLWTPETPVVYDLTVTLGNGDSVTVPFGFRRTEFTPEGMYALNGKVRVLRGVCVHQDMDEKGWARSHEDEKLDYVLIKRMGADAVRTAHYPQSDNVYTLCDRMGLVAWCELPLVDTLMPSVAFRANTAEMVREMVAQLGNHPSICMWSVFNELNNSWSRKTTDAVFGEIVTEMNYLFKRLDATRPTVSATCNSDAPVINGVTDALAINIYPGWYWGKSEMSKKELVRYRGATGRRALGVSEYGAGASVKDHAVPVAGKIAPGGRFHPEEYQCEVHEGNYRGIMSDPNVWGTYLWVMFDFAADTRNEGEKAGINDKGIVTRDRKTLKDAYFFYQAMWTDLPVLHLVGSRAEKAGADKVPVTAYCNRGDVKLSVNGKFIGHLTPDEFKVVHWPEVELVPGENLIELVAGDLRTSARWTR